MDNKKLYRSKKDRIIAGVCGGLAEYFGFDPVLVRLAFALFVLLNGAGLVIYIVMWVVIPKNPEAVAEKEDFNRKEKIREFAQDAGEKIKEAAHEFKKGMDSEEFRSRHEMRVRRRKIIGGAFVIAGLLFLFDEFSPIHFLAGKIFWPGIVILIGVLIITKNYRKHK